MDMPALADRGAAGDADPRAVRICLCAEASGEKVADGLAVVARLIASHPTASTPIV